VLYKAKDTIQKMKEAGERATKEREKKNENARE
jgi:hypothetical protein